MRYKSFVFSAFVACVFLLAAAPASAGCSAWLYNATVDETIANANCKMAEQDAAEAAKTGKVTPPVKVAEPAPIKTTDRSYNTNYTYIENQTNYAGPVVKAPAVQPLLLTVVNACAPRLVWQPLPQVDAYGNRFFGPAGSWVYQPCI